MHRWNIKIYKQACFAGRAQTLLDVTPPTGKTHPFSKIATTFEPVIWFGCPSGFRISLKNLTYFILWLNAPSPPIRAWQWRKDILTKGWLNQSVNESVTEVFEEQPLASTESAYKSFKKISPCLTIWICKFCLCFFLGLIFMIEVFVRLLTLCTLYTEYWFYSTM